MKLLILMPILLISCKVPGDPFSIARPEEITTICHDGATMKFNRSMAKRHLRFHKEDYIGNCKE